MIRWQAQAFRRDGRLIMSADVDATEASAEVSAAMWRALREAQAVTRRHPGSTVWVEIYDTDRPETTRRRWRVTHEYDREAIGHLRALRGEPMT